MAAALRPSKRSHSRQCAHNWPRAPCGDAVAHRRAREHRQRANADPREPRVSVHERRCEGGGPARRCRSAASVDGTICDGHRRHLARAHDAIAAEVGLVGLACRKRRLPPQAAFNAVQYAAASASAPRWNPGIDRRSAIDHARTRLIFTDVDVGIDVDHLAHARPERLGVTPCPHVVPAGSDLRQRSGCRRPAGPRACGVRHVVVAEHRRIDPPPARARRSSSLHGKRVDRRSHRSPEADRDAACSAAAPSQQVRPQRRAGESQPSMACESTAPGRKPAALAQDRLRRRCGTTMP